MGEKIVLIYLAFVVVCSLITFVAYGIDKSKAKRDKRRISEKTLLIMSIIGGGIGGLLGMLKFRHKTKGEHWYFYAVNILGIIINVAVVYLIIKYL